MENRLQFIVYQWPYLIASTIATIISITTHLLVLIFTHQSSKNDNRSYLILIKAFSILTVIGFLTGYLVGGRAEIVLFYRVVVPYGVARFIFLPFLISLLDSLNIHLAPVIPMLLTAMMVFRALIMFNYRFKKTTVYLVIMVIVALPLPLSINVIKNYVPLEQIPLNNVPRTLVDELHSSHTYGVQLDETLAFLLDIFQNCTMFSILIGFITLLLMMWKLHSLRHALAKDTRKLHVAFMMLLTLDLIIIVVFSLVIGSVYTILPQEKADFIVMFTYPIFAISGALQGIASIIFVPYLRAAFRRLFTGNKDGATPSGSQHRTVSVVKITG